MDLKSSSLIDTPTFEEQVNGPYIIKPDLRIQEKREIQGEVEVIKHIKYFNLSDYQLKVIYMQRFLDWKHYQERYSSQHKEDNFQLRNTLASYDMIIKKYWEEYQGFLGSRLIFLCFAREESWRKGGLRFVFQEDIHEIKLAEEYELEKP